MQKKVPLRKCTGCKEMKPKKELLRIVKEAEGTICMDTTGKKAGRGAYICASHECLEKAKKQRGLERSFKCAVSSQLYDHLQQELAEIEKERIKQNLRESGNPHEES